MRLVDVRDGRLGAVGRVAFDVREGRSATGGVRAVESLDAVDLAALARTMTRKYAFLPFPKNGAAKAAIALPASSPAERRERLRAFGAQLKDLVRAGLYRPWTDIGTTDDDLAEIYAGAGLAAPRMGDSGVFTAYSVAGAGLGVCDRLGLDAARATAAIQGFGHVGRELLPSLARRGVRVVAIANRQGMVHDPRGLDAARVGARAAAGDSWIADEGGVRGAREIFAVPCDLFFACADAGTVDAPGAERIAARAVVPAANVPCAPGAEEALRRRGVPLLPDFVVNTGGILGSFLASFGLPRARIEAFEVETYRRVARALLDRAAAASAEPVAFARAATEPRVARLLAMGWLARKGYGAFYRLARAPRPLRRLAAEAALLWAGAALRGRFR